MSAHSELLARRELLLVELHVRRQLLANHREPMLAVVPGNARSVTMRFILTQPLLCWWVASRVLPYVVGRFTRQRATGCPGDSD